MIFLLFTFFSVLFWMIPKKSSFRETIFFFFQWVMCKFVWDFVVNVLVRTWNKTAGRMFGNIEN